MGLEETIRFALDWDIPLLLSLDTQIRLGVELDLAKKELPFGESPCLFDVVAEVIPWCN